ncbi:Derlin 1 [Entomortierella beljakovae]|nr:Derlin 1 [Entomortierella beljakovae]
MAENEILAAYKSVPLITRSLLTATILLSVGVTMRFIPYQLLYLDWSLVIYKFHLHRLLTPFFVTGLSFNMLFDLYFLFTYGSQLESTTFAGKTADFAWFILFTSLTSCGFAHYFGIMYLFQAMILSVISLWSQENSTRIVSFMFGIQFKAIYFPWVLVAYTFVLSGAQVPVSMLIGITSSYIFRFLYTDYPARGGPRLIPTPSLLYRLLPAQEVTGAGFTSGGGTANTFRAGPSGGGTGTGHQWGTGNRLG